VLVFPILGSSEAILLAGIYPAKVKLMKSPLRARLGIIAAAL